MPTSVFLFIAFIVIALVAFTAISLFLSHKLGWIDDGSFARYSQIATIVGLPLGVLAVIVSIAALFSRDRPLSPPPSPSPSPTIARSGSNAPSPTLAPSNEIVFTPTRPQPTASVEPSVSNNQVPAATVEQRDRRVSPATEQTTSQQRPYEPGDIGITRNNGYYELTLENATVSYNPKNCFKGFVDVSNDQKMVAVKFFIKAFTLEVPSIATTQDVNAYYLIDPEQRRLEMSCGDGRYFNVSIDSFQGKPKGRTLTVEFVVPRNTHQLKFRFSPPVGSAIVFNLPNSI